jgi:hypothetical protein
MIIDEKICVVYGKDYAVALICYTPTHLSSGAYLPLPFRATNLFTGAGNNTRESKQTLNF